MNWPVGVIGDSAATVVLTIACVLEFFPDEHCGCPLSSYIGVCHFANVRMKAS
jgi:hypothetical protein